MFWDPLVLDVWFLLHIGKGLISHVYMSVVVHPKPQEFSLRNNSTFKDLISSYCFLLNLSSNISLVLQVLISLSLSCSLQINSFSLTSSCILSLKISSYCFSIFVADFSSLFFKELAMGSLIQIASSTWSFRSIIVCVAFSDSS